MSARRWSSAGKDVAAASGLVAAAYVAPLLAAALTNTAELAVGYAGALRLSLSAAVALWAAALLPFPLLRSRPRAREWLRLSYLWVSVASVASATLFLWNLGVFDGRRVTIREHAGKAAAEALFLAAAGAAVLRFRRRVDERCVAAFAGVAVFAFVPAAAQLGALRKAATAYSARTFTDFDFGDEDLLRFSGKGDVLVFVVDALQTDYFLRALDQRPDLGQAFAGFTCFRNNSGVAPNTTYAVPAMLSGIVYDGSRPSEEYLSRALSGPASLPAVLRRHGYDVRIYSQHAIPYAPGRAAWHNVKGEGEDTAAASGWISLSRLALYRACPLPAKLWLRDDKRFARLQESVVRGLRLRQPPLAERFDDAGLLDRIARDVRTGGSGPVLRWFHLQGVHAPLTLVPEEEQRALEASGRDAIQLQTNRLLEKLAATLTALRGERFFDAATIAIVGDHGHADMRVPAMLVKPPGAAQELDFSDAPTTSSDLPATLAALSGIEGPWAGANAFALDAGAPRERRFYEFYSVDAASGRPKTLKVHVARARENVPASWRVGAASHPGLESRKSGTDFLDFTGDAPVDPARVRGDLEKGLTGIAWSGWLEVELPSPPGAAALVELLYYRSGPYPPKVTIGVGGAPAFEAPTAPYGTFRVYVPAGPPAGRKASRPVVRLSFPPAESGKRSMLLVDVVSTRLEAVETAALAPERSGVNCSLAAVWGSGGGFWSDAPRVLAVGEEIARVLPTTTDATRRTFSFVVPAGALVRPFRYFLVDPETGRRGPVVVTPGACPGA